MSASTGKAFEETMAIIVDENFQPTDPKRSMKFKHNKCKDHHINTYSNQIAF